jgi:hypothetical protein
MTSAEKRLEKVVATLWRAFTAAGHGSISRTEKKLGFSLGYFRNWKRRKEGGAPASIDLLALIRTLEVLGVDPARFFALALSESLLDRIEKEAVALPDEDEPEIRLLRRRWENEETS